MSNRTNIALVEKDTVNVSVDRYSHMLKTIWELKLQVEKEEKHVKELQKAIYKQEEDIVNLLYNNIERTLKSYSVKQEDICIAKQTTSYSFIDNDIAELLSDYHENIQNKVWELIKNYGSDVDQ